MPHLRVEYSQDLAAGPEVAAWLDALHAAACASGLFPASHIKVRAHPVSQYRVGGEVRPFVHVEVRLKSGRSLAQRQALSEAVLRALQDRIGEAVITVEVTEMEAASYARHDPQDGDRDRPD
ncbi:MULTISPECIES: 5-carboxymethyl-2-hydroxymuconate Delta-isomerase [unclassified Thioalkalivibrio]|uniref:5-carboxymethyl-2-hydroxymuconate Delta-isomerase n=1 Tax=unclassified Thioalkalivibrio TaxID=2621013 RepID=UPI000374EBC6|nr:MULTISPECIES: 5-carboxymethyl-2-hydroxymuconate Delta-isomerase [unclassified Thioalkalivibrio]